MWGSVRLNLVIVEAILGLGLLVSFHPLIGNRPLFHPDGVIVLVRNSAIPGELADQVGCGVLAAVWRDGAGSGKAQREANGKTPKCEDYERLPSCDEELKGDAQVCAVNFNIPPGAEGPQELEQLRQALTETIARRHVLGVISDGSSQTDPTVIQVCRTLKVPLLLTSATDDDLLTGARDDVVFRLPPNNSKQAAALQAALRDNKQPLAVLYETNAYGEGLSKELLRLQPQDDRRIYRFRVTPGRDLSQLILRLKDLEVKNIVFLGYYDTAYELLVTLNSHNWRPKLYLADGAYSMELARAAQQLHEGNVEIAYPVDLKACQDDPAKNQFGRFGHDAVVLLRALRDQEAANAAELRGLLHLPKTASGEFAYGRGYKFNERGENDNGEFLLYHLPADQKCESL